MACVAFFLVRALLYYAKELVFSSDQNSDLRPSRLRAGAWVLVPAIAMVFMFAMLATAGATRTEPGDSAIDDLDLPEDEAPLPLVAPWTMPDDFSQRTGYRRGRRTPIDIVALGPDQIEVEIETARAFLAMRAAAAKSGVELQLESGFRTHQHQRRLYRAYRRGKRKKKAARPGRSNHQSGRALDIAVRTVPDAGDWLEANAASFGFVRTVKREPWHWEYVEAPRARKKATKRSRGARARRAAKAKKRKKRRARRARRARKRSRR